MSMDTLPQDMEFFGELQRDLERQLVEQVRATEVPAIAGPVNPAHPPGHGSNELRPLDRNEVAAAIESALANAIGGDYSSEISEERRLAIRYYLGKGFGNETPGRSSVVLRDVADTIEWIMPSLMRMFTGGRELVRYVPSGPEDEQWAQQATDYINHEFQNNRRLSGSMLLYEWMKAALLEKVGFAVTYAEERYEPQHQTYLGLTELELTLLLDDKTLELVAFEERREPLETVEAVPGPDGMPMPVPSEQPLFDVEVRVVKKRVEIRHDVIAPEEFLMGHRDKYLNDETYFCAWRQLRTASDLIAMGYPEDVVINLPSDDSAEWTEERIERLTEDEEWPRFQGDRPDPAARQIWVTTCYMRIDEDGDGYAELRKIVCVGRESITILSDQQISHNPVASLCPVPIPHKFFGMSMADLVMDLQLIRSTVLRQMLDNLYYSNNSRVGVVEGEVEIEDLLTTRPGGVVRAQSKDAVFPLNDSRPMGSAPQEMLEYLEEVRAGRTGVTKYNQGLDATALNHTATGVASIMNAAMQRIENIARIFAETGIKQFFRNRLRVLCEAPVSQRVYRYRGEWVEADPNMWNADMDCEVVVGLGVGAAAERISMLQRLMEMQGIVSQSPAGQMMVTPDNIYATAEATVEAMGVKDPEKFFTNPNGAPPPEPAPDPEMVRIQADAEMARQKAEVDLRNNEQKHAENMQRLALQAAELAQERELQLAQIESNERIALSRGSQEAA